MKQKDSNGDTMSYYIKELTASLPSFQNYNDVLKDVLASAGREEKGQDFSILKWKQMGSQ